MDPVYDDIQAGMVTGKGTLDYQFINEAMRNADSMQTNECFPNASRTTAKSNFEVRPGQLIWHRRNCNPKAAGYPQGDANLPLNAAVNGFAFSQFESLVAAENEIVVDGVAITGSDLESRMDGGTLDTESGFTFAYTGTVSYNNPTNAERTIYAGDQAMWELPANPLTEGPTYVIPAENPGAPEDRGPGLYDLQLVPADPTRMRPTLMHAHTLLTSEFFRTTTPGFGGLETGIAKLPYHLSVVKHMHVHRVLSKHQEHALAYKYGLLQPLLTGLMMLLDEGMIRTGAGADISGDEAKIKAELISIVEKLGGVFSSSLVNDTKLQQFFNLCFLDHQSWATSNRDAAITRFTEILGKSPSDIRKNPPTDGASNEEILRHLMATGVERAQIAFTQSYHDWARKIIGTFTTNIPPGGRGTLFVGLTKVVA